MLNPNLLKLAIDVLKELPSGAVYSNTKKPPEGATEYTTTGGAKYWIPKKSKGQKLPSDDIEALMAEIRAKIEGQRPKQITPQNIDEFTNLDYIDSLEDGHRKNMLSLRLWFGDIEDEADQKSENYKKLEIIRSVELQTLKLYAPNEETAKKREEILSKLIRKRREGKLTDDELFEKIDTKHDQYRFNNMRKPVKYFEDTYIADDGTISPKLLETRLGRSHAQDYKETKMRLEMFTYDLVKKRPNIFPERSFPPETIEDMPDSQRLNSKITPELATVAHKALLKDRDIYETILKAYQSTTTETLESGAVRSRHTFIDDAVNGKKDDVSYKEFYETFEPVRKHLKETFGDTITLYRATARTEDEVHAEGDDKPTRNFASSREQAMQYGTRIIKEEVPIENILALNVAMRGMTDEFIVLRGEHAITKSISKSMNNKILTRAIQNLKKITRVLV